mmetsp:Transcript_62802/g.162957  ORF Transcript_62802/g.162957 Transcript_62802/m.162957 type:complete len:234 (-) Transcript_62802:6-707(-)
MRLHLKLLQATKRHLVDVAEQTGVFVEPILDAEVDIVPERHIRWRRSHMLLDLMLDDVVKFLGCLLGRADPMSSSNTVRPRLLDQRAPGLVVLLDEADGPLGVVDLEVQLRLVASVAALEVVDPIQALADATGSDALDVLDRARLPQRPRLLRVHRQDLPICLALVDKADRAQWPALNHLADAHRAVTEIKDVERVIVAWRIVELVDLVWVTEGLGKAAVVEGHGAPESCKAI